ncbi:hypothetical protein L226DRAFT_284313 [Lentinus tigrinus ALCF2SS1-7]|uniref:uncharacterized protein n=1 Tax=Lentinus tigrinus ALCF2SS1-7 TaxID=1328758 RepID=UPI0011660478|nr:hypothetical protein L226DRAFT_284313 [Lentinus tigrinus ALCF2SS1-7]
MAMHLSFQHLALVFALDASFTDGLLVETRAEARAQVNKDDTNRVVILELVRDVHSLSPCRHREFRKFGKSMSPQITAALSQRPRRALWRTRAPNVVHHMIRSNISVFII